MLKAVITDVDGTITDSQRRISTSAITCMRHLVDAGVPVVIASGNTVCFMDCFCRMIGTDGTIIAENGGVYRVGYSGHLHINGDQSVCWKAFETLKDHFTEKNITLDLYSPDYRFADVAFARTVDADEVGAALRHHPVEVLDTGFAIHIQSRGADKGTDKGTALKRLADEMGLKSADFLAVGDSMNDVGMLTIAGAGVAVANAHPDTKSAAEWVASKKYGDGFVEGIRRYSHLLF